MPTPALSLMLDDFTEKNLRRHAVSTIGQIGTLTSVYVYDDEAQYLFTEAINGNTITFPVDFIKENGTWKILEF